MTTVSTIAKTKIADKRTINKKLVPHRGCCVGKDCEFFMFTSYQIQSYIQLYVQHHDIEITFLHRLT